VVQVLLRNVQARECNYMPIIVLNLANLPINSATSNAGFEYSVHNAISPKHFYIHDTLPGIYYDLRVRWTTHNPAYEADIGTVAMMVGGTAIALIGLVLAPFTAGLSIKAGAVAYKAIGTGMALGLALAKGAVPVGLALGADAVSGLSRTRMSRQQTTSNGRILKDPIQQYLSFKEPSQSRKQRRSLLREKSM